MELRVLSRANSVLALAVVAVASLAGCIVIPVADLLKPMPLRETIIESGEGYFYRPKVAIIDIEGTITSREFSSAVYSTPNALDEIQSRLEVVEDDPEVVALLLRISSPGGEATACDVIRREVLELKRKRKLPVVACIVETGASGGYYIATAADTIVAHPTAVVGSIGVLLQTVNVDGLMRKIGVSFLTIKSGDYKDLGSPFRPASEQEVQILDGIVRQLHERFVEVVDEGRTGLSRDEVSALADGTVWAAAEARARGLVDSVGYLDDAIREARERSREPGAAVVRYTRAGRPGGNLYSIESPADGGLTLEISTGRLPETRFLYLWVP